MKDLIEHRSFAWRISALKLAEKTLPKTSWTANPIYSHRVERLSLANMQEQLVEQSLRERGKMLRAILLWATTGHWPTVRNAASFFLREAIQAALRQYPTDSGGSAGNTTEAFACPPWTMDEAAWLSVEIAMEWYIRGCARWASHTARSAFESQESSFRSQHPYD